MRYDISIECVTMEDEKTKEEKLHKYCLRCGKRLKSLENRKRGMGKTCWEKSQTDKPKMHLLF